MNTGCSDHTPTTNVTGAMLRVNIPIALPANVNISSNANKLIFLLNFGSCDRISFRFSKNMKNANNVVKTVDHVTTVTQSRPTSANLYNTASMESMTDTVTM